MASKFESNKPAFITGGCECRNIRYKISFPEGSEWPPTATHCHCSQCRKTLGGLFSTCMYIPVKNFFHESSETFKVYESSENGRRVFCGNCGGGIYTFEKQPGDIYFVFAASVDTECLNKDLLAGLQHDLFSQMAVEGVDDAVGKKLQRHVGDSTTEAPAAAAAPASFKKFSGNIPFIGSI